MSVGSLFSCVMWFSCITSIFSLACFHQLSQLLCFCRALLLLGCCFGGSFSIRLCYADIFCVVFVCLWRDGPQWAKASSFERLLDHTQRRITVGRTPLDEWSARHRDLYLTTHNTHNRQTSMPPVGFEPTISAGERQQTYALDCATTGTGFCLVCYVY